MGGLDVVVNNVGIGVQGTIETNSIDEWQRVFDDNVFGIVRVNSRRVRISGLAARGDRQHMSICVTAGLPERALYSATKGAVMSLTFAMAADHLREGLGANCVKPRHRRHPVDRPAAREGPPPRAGARRIEARHPSGRLVSAEEVADAIPSRLAVGECDDGMALAVDGGMRACVSARDSLLICRDRAPRFPRAKQGSSSRDRRLPRSLGQLGAEVIKVELPNSGDHARWLPVAPGDFRSAYFAACNRGKRSVTLDLRNVGTRGVPPAHRHSRRPHHQLPAGNHGRMGARLRRAQRPQPALVYAAGSAFGVLGPDASRTGADLSAQASGGLISGTGVDGASRPQWRPRSWTTS